MVDDDPHPASHEAHQPGTDDWAKVRRELDRLRDLARGLSLDDVREGAWFARLLKFSLDRYVREVDAAYFQANYPDLTPEKVVQARIQQAARLASLEGGISAGTYTGAVAATLGSAGGASALTLPAAGLSFLLDLLFVSNLQLRLTHDIAVIYGVPLDLSDPEDLWKLIRVAFAIKSEEVGRGAIGKGVPVLVRPIIQRVFSTSTQAAAKSLPVIGRYLLKRNLVKFALPAVGVPLSMAVNYWSTRVAADHAERSFGEEARILRAARRMTEETDDHAALLWVLWLIVKSDALIHEKERLLLKHVTSLVGDLDSELAAITGLQSGLSLDQKQIWAMLADAHGDLKALYDAGVVAAGIDGKVNPNELTSLRKLATFCKVPFDEQAVRHAAAESR